MGKFCQFLTVICLQSDNGEGIIVLCFFQPKSADICLIPPLNIYCGYLLEVPQLGASNEYPQQMFSWRNKKKYYVEAPHTWSCDICLLIKGPQTNVCTCIHLAV